MKLPSGLMLKREQVIERVAGMYANRYGDIGEGGGGIAVQVRGLYRASYISTNFVSSSAADMSHLNR